MITDIKRELIASLQKHLQDHHYATLVIDGDCAAGKTTLASQIAAQTDATVFHLDDFFLPPALRTEARLREAGGNIDYDRFLTQVLQPLGQRIPFTYNVFSCHDSATHTVSVSPAAITIIEGSYALHPLFLETYRALHAIKVFLTITPDEQLRRIEQRNGKAMLRRFRAEWIPMEKQYRQAFSYLWTDVRTIDSQQLLSSPAE